jgi:hypothetical protein
VDELYDMYSIQMQQENFAALVSVRVNDILAGTAQVLDFPKVDRANTPAEQGLLFADLIARSVCHNLNKEGDK